MLSVSVFFATGQLTSMRIPDHHIKYLEWTKARNLFLSIVFTVFFFIYAIVFLRLIIQLKEHFPHFFMKEKGRLYSLGTIIMFSIVCRVSTSFAYGLLYEKILLSA